MGINLHSLEVAFEQDVVLARRAARRIAVQLGFDPQDQTRIATSVSEIARNAFQHAGRGLVEFSLSGRTEPQLLEIRVTDSGPGIATGVIRQPSGMGIVGARRLMDNFHVQSRPGAGTVVQMTKILPRRSGLISAADVANIRRTMQAGELENPFEEIRRQNQEC